MLTLKFYVTQPEDCQYILRSRQKSQYQCDFITYQRLDALVTNDVRKLCVYIIPDEYVCIPLASVITYCMAKRLALTLLVNNVLTDEYEEKVIFLD